jgi:hypothetical protein
MFFILRFPLFLTAGVARQSHWPNLGCSSKMLRNTVQGRSAILSAEGQRRIGEAAASLMVLFANLDYHLMQTTLLTLCLVWTVSSVHIGRKIFVQIPSD